MQWLIAFICACICFAILSNLQKKPEKDEPENKNNMILFFFIVLIFQIVFYYFDIVSFFKSSSSQTIPTKVEAESVSNPSLQLPHFSKSQQEFFEKELLRNIHQDINVGYPNF